MCPSVAGEVAWLLASANEAGKVAALPSLGLAHPYCSSPLVRLGMLTYILRHQVRFERSDEIAR